MNQLSTALLRAACLLLPTAATVAQDTGETRQDLP